jgi:hypothetical protein
VSIRELFFVQTDRPAAEIATLLAKVGNGSAEKTDGNMLLLFPTDHLVAGVSGRFGGPVLDHAPGLPFRPDGEFEAPDLYNVEIRLWQADGPRVHPVTGADVEEAAATALFSAVVACGLTAIHVHDDDKLVRATVPGQGSREFAKGTTVYDWDADKWGGFVAMPGRR